MQRTARQSASRGVTLIELLVVVTILVMLMAYATSVIKPTLEDRKNREAAQLVSSYFSAAQARAAEKGRPEGVWLERASNDDNKVLQMFAATSPPPFMGSTTTSRVGPSGFVPDYNQMTSDAWAIDADGNNTIEPDKNGDGYPDDADNDGFIDEGFDLDGVLDSNGDPNPDVGWVANVTLVVNSTTPDSLISYPLVRPGDKIRFDFQGPVYRIVRVAAPETTSGPYPRGVKADDTALGAIYIAPLDDAAFRPPVTGKSYAGLPFQIFRQPKKSIVAAAEFPTGISLDLALSGFGVSNKIFRALDPGDGTSPQTDDRTPVVIMFNPSGGVDRVYYHNTSVRPVDAIQLLIGQFEYSFADRVMQLNDDRNRWITINQRSGEVSAVPIKLEEGTPIPNDDPKWIKASREYTFTSRDNIAATIGSGG